MKSLLKCAGGKSREIPNLAKSIPNDSEQHSKLLQSTEIHNKDYSESTKLKTVDLFSGCGGSSLGYQNAGFDIVGAFENWNVAADCYKANFSHPVYCEDLSNVARAVALIKELSPDIIIGSPPCQDFSTAGKRKAGNRAALTVAFAEIVTQVEPRFFVMENVPGVTKSDEYKTARKLFKQAGYGLTETVLNASYYSVPQRRERFFCIGILGDADGVLSNIKAEAKDKKKTTVRDYFGNSLGIEHYYQKPPYAAGLRRSIFSIDEPSPTVRTVNGNITSNFKPHEGDSCKLNSSIRKLTYLERAQIQTFPISFNWDASIGKKGGNGAIEKMIGNAVPPKLAEYVGKQILEYLQINNIIL
jgi:DNA (cytosine-5)-methyltransferase 1